MILTKKVMIESDKNKVVSEILDLVKEYKLTPSNLVEIFEELDGFMLDNSTVERD